eukprot:gene6222-7751_t
MSDGGDQTLNTNDNQIEEDEDNIKDEDQDEELKKFIDNKPKEFIEFLNNNNIPIDSYNVKEIPRFIRIKPKNDNHQLIKDIESEIGTKLIKVNWLPNFYKLEKSVNIASSKLYKSGTFYGMDASSGAAVVALDPQPNDNVLDICCAPGSKLCLVSDLIGGDGGSVTGVDIASNRLGTCKTILKKYKIPNARLFISDGTTFSIKAPNKSDPIPQNRIDDRKALKKLKLEKKSSLSTNNNNSNQNITSVIVKEKENKESKTTKITEENEDNNLELTNNKDNNNNNKRKFKTKKSTKRGWFDVPELFFCNTFYMRYSNSQLYDRVIIDAECSLDASVRHLLCHSKIGRYLDQEKLNSLTNLQKKLIQSGFNLLKEGGVLVYSTCSFCRDQNESVVGYLLNNNRNSKLIPAFGKSSLVKYKEDNNNNDFLNYIYQSELLPWSPGFIENTYRFYPKNGTSGMFIAKILKIKE